MSVGPPLVGNQILIDGVTTTVNLLTFTNYIREQWIEGNIFTVTDLSIFGMETRTNNDVEGYHYRI